MEAEEAKISKDEDRQKTLKRMKSGKQLTFLKLLIKFVK